MSLQDKVSESFINLATQNQILYDQHHNRYLNDQVTDDIWLVIAKNMGHNEDATDCLQTFLCLYKKGLVTTASDSNKSEVQNLSVGLI